MWRILQVMANNLKERAATVRLPDSVPAPAGFRGRVILDPARCLACGVCAYVCVSDAITGVNEERAYHWSYEPARCTFCARCADCCPGRALSMDPHPLPVYAHLGELAAQCHVPFPVCRECGAPTRPVTTELLSHAFEHIREDTRELAQLCERCRRRRLQRSLFVASYDRSKENLA